MWAGCGNQPVNQSLLSVSVIRGCPSLSAPHLVASRKSFVDGVMNFCMAVYIINGKFEWYICLEKAISTRKLDDGGRKNDDNEFEGGR